jgi:O-antigen/teichoic acid export membrane protein
MGTLFWGYFSRVSSIASSLIIMPFALIQFSAEAFSIWMIFVTFYGLIVVFDFGLTTTISRQYNYILAGAKSIEQQGVSESAGRAVDKKLFTHLYLSSKAIFSTIAVGATLLLIAVYYFYLLPITTNYQLSIALEWLLYSIAIVISLYCLSYNAIFFGTHNIESIYRVCSVSNLIFFVSAITLIQFDYGLLAIAIGRILSAIAYFIFAKYEIKKFAMMASFEEGHAANATEVLKKLFPNATKLGGVTLGNFLVTKVSVLLVASYFPLAISGSYSLTLNIFSVMMSVCLLFMTIKTPTLNVLRQEAKNIELLRQQKKIRLVCLLTGSFFFASFALLGGPILEFIGSSTKLANMPVIWLFSVLSLLEINRLISMNFIMTANKVPFLKPALLTGVISIVLTISLFEWGYISLLMPIIVQLLAQSFFNNWYWTKQEFKERALLLKKVSPSVY